MCSLSGFLLPQAPAPCSFSNASVHRQLLYYINTVWLVTVVPMDGRLLYLKSIDMTEHFQLLNIVHFLIKIDQLDVTCFLLFHYLMLKMLRMLVHPSSGACDLFAELFHVLCCSGSMCVGVTVWFGWGGVVSLCRLKLCFSLHKDNTPL